VIDPDGDGQLVATVESHTDHEFVDVAEHICSAHRSIDLDPRQGSDPPRQMLASISHFASAPELRLRIVDEELGDDGQQRGRLPIPRLDQASQDLIEVIGITRRRCERSVSPHGSSCWRC
jgi:hypothetical protein